MGLRIIYGRAGSGKSQFCYSEIANLIGKEKKIYIITPEQFSYTAEKKLMEAIEPSAVFHAEVLTLSRMAHRVLQETGVGKQVNLTESGRSMLLYSILTKNKKQFQFLGKSDENIELARNAIKEFKKHGVTIPILQQSMEKTEDIYLKTKLRDILFLYEKFQEQIDNQYIDESDLLTQLSNKLEEIDWIKHSIIYLDEFTGFTYPEYQVLIQLMKQAKQVNLTMCLDSLSPIAKPDTDVFYSNKITLSKLMDLTKQNEITLEKPVYLQNSPRFQNQELKHLEKELFQFPSTKYEQNVENVHLFLAKNQYSEIERVAKEIVNLVRENKLRYRDIAVITRNIETYSSLVRAIFREYNIPVFIDEKRDLNQNSLIQYILSILAVVSQNFSRESIFQYLKTGFFDISQDELFLLENYCIKWGIHHHKWRKDFQYESQDESKQQQVERFNQLRGKIMNPFLFLKEKGSTVSSITKALYEFIIEQQIEEKMTSKIKELQQKGLLDLANEAISSYQIVMDLMDEMVSIFGEEKVTFSQYEQILKVGLKNSGLGKIPGTQDQVVLGDIERSRSHKVHTIFMIGLNDGSFPNINRQEGFLGDSDRQYLASEGIELAKGTIDNLYEENFNIYKGFTTAENELYISYASSDSEGKSLRPSMYIGRIKKIFPQLKEKSDVIRKDYEILNEKVTYEILLEMIAKSQEGEKIDTIWQEVYQYFKEKEEWKEKLQRDIQGVHYTNIPKNINPETIEKLYGNTLTTSVSKLEKYRSCPFSYYLQYGLKLKEKEELKIQSFDTGSFMHQIIDRFFEVVKEEKIELPTFLVEEEKIEIKVNQIVEEELENQNRYLFTATAKYKVLVKRLKRMIATALKYIIESLIYSDFKIEGTEVEFGRKGDYKPIVLSLENGKKVEIIGKIDRIDTANTPDGNYVRIIDYKSSVKNIDLNEVYAGIQIQLLTYMDAICKEKELESAGVFYFNLLEQMVKADQKITEQEIEEEIRKNFKMKGLILADVKVIKMQDKNLKNGVSKIIPAGITTSGEINQSKTNGIQKEDFQVLQKYINQTIKQIAKEILSGKIDLKPYYKKGNTPCQYCAYHSICGFQAKNPGNCYFYINHQSKDDVLLKIKKEMEK